MSDSPLQLMVTNFHRVFDYVESHPGSFKRRERKALADLPLWADFVYGRAGERGFRVNVRPPTYSNPVQRYRFEGHPDSIQKHREALPFIAGHEIGHALLAHTRGLGIQKLRVSFGLHSESDRPPRRIATPGKILKGLLQRREEYACDRFAIRAYPGIDINAVRDSLYHYEPGLEPAKTALGRFMQNMSLRFNDFITGAPYPHPELRYCGVARLHQRLQTS